MLTFRNNNAYNERVQVCTIIAKSVKTDDAKPQGPWRKAEAAGCRIQIASNWWKFF